LSPQVRSPERTQQLSRNEVIVPLAVVAFFSLTFAAVGHHECTTNWADVPRPDAGSPRANYCSVTDVAFPLLQVAIPLLIVAGALVIAKRSSGIVSWVAAVVVLVAFAHMLLCVELDARDYRSAFGPSVEAGLLGW
jgi:hypothetical protein